MRTLQVVIVIVPIRLLCVVYHASGVRGSRHIFMQIPLYDKKLVCIQLKLNSKLLLRGIRDGSFCLWNISLCRLLNTVLTLYIRRWLILLNSIRLCISRTSNPGGNAGTTPLRCLVIIDHSHEALIHSGRQLSAQLVVSIQFSLPLFVLKQIRAFRH